MATGKSGGGDSWLGNPNVLLALVTIAGGVWLVSHKLTSDRPVASIDDARGFIGDQKLEARLWEDPFKKAGSNDSQKADKESSSPVPGLDILVQQIKRRSAPDSDVRFPNGTLVLPVMISGGQYSEDQESRIRSRFAIVSALGQAGYVPEDAQRIGTVRIPWLTQRELSEAMRKAAPDLPRLWEKASAPPGASPALPPDSWTCVQSGAADEGAPIPRERLLGVDISGTSAHMQLRYEWYRPRAFSAGAEARKLWPGVLVLWLDDSYFEDEPLLRLPLLLEPLTVAPDPAAKKTRPPTMAVIGPRNSTTLRAMLRNWPSKENAWPAVPDRLKELARAVLNRVDLYCATPSAMDEVLVEQPVDPDETPRESVLAKLKKAGFKSAHNFAATDAQMAGEILKELKLRGVDLGKKDNHVVLISEWDTFYARMLALTYGAELALLQQKETKSPDTSRADFINRYISLPPTERVMPGNFHSFVYLRGLDGQTVGGGSANGEARADRGRAGKSPPASVDEFHFWVPDVNKAEGPAQFDYLGRIGDQVEELQQLLEREGDGRIKAMGIVGSDVYDTLLILQALRDRFRDVLFFTTDLDVRFVHPREREWARNLIVVSSYGLALHPDLQGVAAPFRDSTQTAQFAAALAALGNEQLAGLTRIEPRRFEIGNRVAVDLSAQRAPPCGTPAPAFQLHPLRPSAAQLAPTPGNFPQLWWGLLAAVFLVIGLSWVWKPLQRLTWTGWAYSGEVLEYSEEDIGGPDGAEALLRGLEANPDHEIAQWLLRDPRLDKAIAGNLPAALASPAAANNWKRDQALAELTDLLVERLNQLLDPTDGSGANPDSRPPLVTDAPSGRLMSIVRPWPGARPLMERHDRRRALDRFLDRVAMPGQVAAMLAKPHAQWKDWDVDLWHYLSATHRCLQDKTNLTPLAPAGSDESQRIQSAALVAAVAARASTEGMFRLRVRQLVWFWGGVAGFGVAGACLARAIWMDTFSLEDGEAFSLTNGTSAWPAQIVRLLVLALAVALVFGLSHKIRETFLLLTRAFRFPLPKTGEDEPANRVCAQGIWYQYRKDGHFEHRLKRVRLALGAYFLLLVFIYNAFGDVVLNPVRGPVLAEWNGTLLLISFLGFLLLAMFTVDAACQCREFIEQLSARPTQYPEATRHHFSRQMGRIDDHYIDEWIDLHLIAELTEQIGRLVYYPTGLLLLLLVARNAWWDGWTWPAALLVIYLLNFSLALASVVILQRAAKEAKRKAELSLTAKVKKLQARTEPSVAHNDAARAKELLEEVRSLDRGAFVPFWENPVVGAIFLSSGGTTMLQLAIWFMGR